MKRFLFLLVLPLAAHALDLTPRAATRELEGFKIPVLHFKDGERTVRYQPPAKWEHSGGGTELTFVPPGEPDAAMKLQVNKRKIEEGAPVETPEELAKWAQTLMPKEATDIKLLATNPSPFTLDARTSIDFVFTYIFGGRRFNKSVAICDLSPAERLVVTVTARAQVYDAIRDAAISSLFSWQ